MTEVSKISQGVSGLSLPEGQTSTSITENGKVKDDAFQRFKEDHTFQKLQNSVDDLNMIAHSRELAFPSSNGSIAQIERQHIQPEIDFNNTKEHNSLSEKIGSTCTVIVSEHKRKLEEIKGMSDAALEDAYFNPDFSEYEKDIENEMNARMNINDKDNANDEKLIGETQKQKSELTDTKAQELNKAKNESELEQTKNTQATETENVTIGKATEVEKVGEKKASVLEEEALVFTKDGKVSIPSKANGPIEGVISLGRENGILKASKENLKRFKIGTEIEFVDKDNVTQSIKIKGHEKLSKEDEEKLQTYISNNFTSIALPSSAKTNEESKKSTEENISTNLKVKESHREEIKQNMKTDTTQINGERMVKAQSNLESASNDEKFNERFEKYEKKLDELEIDVIRDVEKHQKIVEDTKRKEDSIQIEKSSIKIEELHAEIFKLDDKHKDILHTVQNDNRIPLATRQKFKAILTQFRSLEKKVSDSALDVNKKEKYTEQIFEIKKDFIELSKEVLKENGIQMTKGTDLGGKTEA